MLTEGTLYSRTSRLYLCTTQISTLRHHDTLGLSHASFRQGYQPNIAQVLGISHSFIEKPFYVVECGRSFVASPAPMARFDKSDSGTTSLLRHFLNVDGMPLVTHWFTHVSQQHLEHRIN